MLISTLASPRRRGERTKTSHWAGLTGSHAFITLTRLPPAGHAHIGARSGIGHRTLLRYVSRSIARSPSCCSAAVDRGGARVVTRRILLTTSWEGFDGQEHHGYRPLQLPRSPQYPVLHGSRRLRCHLGCPRTTSLLAPPAALHVSQYRCSEPLDDHGFPNLRLELRDHSASLPATGTQRCALTNQGLVRACGE